jgi:hypothetical protein
VLFGLSLYVGGVQKYSTQPGPELRTRFTRPNRLSEVSRQRQCECLRQAQDVLPIEIGDDEPEEASRRQRGHGWAGVAGLQFWSRWRRRVRDEQ